MRKLLFGYSVCALIVLASCHKKAVPNKRTDSMTVLQGNTSTPANTAKPDSQVVVKPVVKRKPKVAVAKVITVNDGAAKKSVDGRLYYDVAGNRYWKNYKDGKYYLFDKSQFNNPDFKTR